MIKAQEVFDLLNKYGREGKSCLFAINYKMTRGIFVSDPLKQKNILFRVGDISNIPKRKLPLITLKSYPESLDDYKSKFDIIQKHLINGNTFLANLTIKTPIKLDSSSSGDDLLADLAVQVSGSNTRYILYCPENFLCFLPETFVRIDKNARISSFPMKGTIDADMPDAENVILNDYKETAEHSTIVDFIRSDLSRVATDIQVDRFRFITRVEKEKGTILQVSSEISGHLSNKFYRKNMLNLGDVIKAQLPAGSICGAPKMPTCEAIDEAENDADKRGYYSGVMGYFDGKELDSAVMIRFIEQSGSHYFFHSGGGITINSSLKSEYQEVIEKIYLPQIESYIETICIESNGSVPLKKYHLDRVSRTNIGEDVEKEIEKLIDKYSHNYETAAADDDKKRYKLRIVYNMMGLSDVSCVEYNIRPVIQLIFKELPDIDYHHKYLNRSMFDNIGEAAENGGFKEVIITKNGALTDMRYANIVFEDYNGDYFTPDTPLLKGTRRAQLLDAHIIHERHITIEDLHLQKGSNSFKAVHLINGMMSLNECVVPIENVIF